MKFKESKLAHKYCKGFGMEIGPAAHNPFNLENCLFLAHGKRVDFWRESEINMCGEYIKPDVYGSAEEIPIKDNMFNYVISSHVIEHVPNPIKTFKEWQRVVKKDGIIFIIFPKRNAEPMDVDRPISTLQSFIDQYENPQPLTDEHRHIWIFTLQLMVDIIDYCNDNKIIGWEILEALETDDKVGNGHCIICRKK